MQHCYSAPPRPHLRHFPVKERNFLSSSPILYQHVFIAIMLSLLCLFVALFLASVVDAFAAWLPNCTTPTQHVNFVSSPQARGTMDIIWTCFAVLSLCTWTVQHLMVPVHKEYEKGELHFHTPNYGILTNSYPILHFHTPMGYEFVRYH